MKERHPAAPILETSGVGIALSWAYITQIKDEVFQAVKMSAVFINSLSARMCVCVKYR